MNNKYLTITPEWLLKYEACQGQREHFEKLFAGGSWRLTLSGALLVHDHFQWPWLSKFCSKDEQDKVFLALDDARKTRERAERNARSNCTRKINKLRKRKMAQHLRLREMVNADYLRRMHLDNANQRFSRETCRAWVTALLRTNNVEVA